jgi:hypothetical protein
MFLSGLYIKLMLSLPKMQNETHSTSSEVDTITLCNKFCDVMGRYKKGSLYITSISATMPFRGGVPL